MTRYKVDLSGSLKNALSIIKWTSCSSYSLLLYSWSWSISLFNLVFILFSCCEVLIGHLYEACCHDSRLNMQTTNFLSDKGSSASQAEKEEVDSRSIYVSNVDYACTAQEIRRYFEPCGIVNRVTIPVDEYRHPKGFAFVEFDNINAVENALSLNESKLHGRKIKVSTKRTNIPGMKQYCRRTVGFRSRRPFMNSPSYPPYGQGRVPTFRRPTRYRPY